MGVVSSQKYSQEAGVVSKWNLWVLLVSIVVRRYIIDILIIIITFPYSYSTCISSFWQHHPYFFVRFFMLYLCNVIIKNC